MGSLLAAGLYKIFKVLDYESVNPGQDDTGKPIKHPHFRSHHQQHGVGDLEEGRAPRNDGLGQ